MIETEEVDFHHNQETIVSNHLHPEAEGTMTQNQEAEVTIYPTLEAGEITDQGQEVVETLILEALSIGETTEKDLIVNMMKNWVQVEGLGDL